MANGFCSIHSDPERASELGRKSGASRRNAASSDVFLVPPPRSAVDLNRALAQIFSKVCSGQVDPGVGKALSYIASVLVKTIELSDHEIRLRAMEHVLNSVRPSGGKE